MFLFTEGVRVFDSRSNGQGFITYADPSWFISSLRYCLPLDSLVAHVKRDLVLGRARFYLSQSPTSPVATDDKDDAASSRRTEQAKRGEERQEGTRTRRTTSYPSLLRLYRWRYRVRKCTAPLFHLSSSCPLHPSPLFSHPVPTAACASCSMARKITEPSIVFSLLPCPTDGIFAEGQYAGNSELGRCYSPDGKPPKEKSKHKVTPETVEIPAQRNAIYIFHRGSQGYRPSDRRLQSDLYRNAR